MHGTHSNILQNVLALSWTQLAGRLIRFVYLVAVARFLGSDDVGVFSYGMAAYISLTAMAIFGQDLLLATRVGRKRYMFGTVAAHSLVILAASLLVVMTFGFIALWNTESDATHLRALSFLLLAVGARGAVVWIRSCFVAIERAAWIPRYEVAFRGLEAISGIGALASGAGLVTISLLHVVFWLLEAAVSWQLMVRMTGFAPGQGIRGGLLRKYASASAGMAISPWLLLAFPQIPVIALRQIQPDLTAVAHLGIAMQCLTTLFIVPVALAHAMLPGVARSIRSRDPSDLLLVITALKVCLVLGALLASIGVTAAPALVMGLFGDRYARAGDAVAWLMWALGPYSAAYIAIAVLNGIGQRTKAALCAVALVLCQSVLMLWLHPGEPGDALRATVATFLVASLAGMLWSVVALSQALMLKGPTWWLRPLGIVAACAALGLATSMSSVWKSVLGCTLVVVGSVVFGVFSRAEVHAAIVKSGLTNLSSLRFFFPDNHNSGK